MSDDVHHPYDRSLKLIFSHAVMMESLIKGFVTEEWAKDLDFSSLRTVEVKHITDDLRSREDDVIWRINFKNIPIYIVCLVEFQTSVEQFMVARLLTYTGLIYEGLVKQKDPLIKKQKKLPPIFPLVFYTGSRPWRAPQRLRDCLVDNIPGVLKQYQADIGYQILDISQLELDKYPAKADNLVVPIIELERVSSIENSILIVNKLAVLLRGSKFDSLRRAFLIYIKKALKLNEICPGADITELQEVNTMLAENIERWKRQYERKALQKGIEEGIEKGIEKGIQQGRQTLIYVLEQLLKSRDQVLSKELKAELSYATLSEIQQFIDKILNEKLIEA